MTKHLLLLFATIFMAVGTASAENEEQTTVDFTQQGWSNNDSLTLKTITTDNFTVSFDCTAKRNSNGFKGLPTYIDSNPCVRLFAHCHVIVTANSGKAITQIDFTFANSNRARLNSSNKPNCNITTSPAITTEIPEDSVHGWNFKKNNWKGNATEVQFGKNGGNGQIDVASIVVYTEDSTISGISDIKAADKEVSDNRVYSLSGNYVGTSLANLPKGVYIQNGKKYVVR